MGARENKVEKTVSDYAEGRGVLSFKWVSPGTAGVCDRLFICKHRVFFIEFKAPGEPTKPHQTRHHIRLANLRQHVYVVDNIDIGKEIIDYESENRPHPAAIRGTHCDQRGRKEST